jgi:cobalt-zinc-cadmium efflux system outer membrane protein
MKLQLSMLLLFALPACTQVDPQLSYDHARDLVEASTGRSDAPNPSLPVLSSEEIDGLLLDGLGLDEALHLALTSNRGLRAAFQEIGVANAERVQAGMLANPSLGLLLRFPIDGGLLFLEAVLGVELLQFWSIADREDAAEAELESTLLHVARSCGEVLGKTRRAYAEAQAASMLERVATENLGLATRAFEAMDKLHANGMGDALDKSLALGPKLAAEMELEKARMQARHSRRRLAICLSLARNVDGLELSDELLLQPQSILDPEALVLKALEARLDLRAMEAAIRALDVHVRLEEKGAWGELVAGPAIERPGDGSSNLIGPSLSLSLPIFDQNQAQVARAAAQLQGMVLEHQAARIAISQDIRTQADRRNQASRALSFHQDELMPQVQRSHGLALRSHGAKVGSLQQVLETQRLLLEARSAQVQLALEYAVSSADLEYALGAPLAD